MKFKAIIILAIFSFSLIVASCGAPKKARCDAYGARTVQSDCIAS